MIDAGKDADGLQLVRVYDALMGTYSDPILEGSLRALSPGWVEPTAERAVLDVVEEKVSALRY